MKAILASTAALLAFVGAPVGTFRNEATKASAPAGADREAVSWMPTLNLTAPGPLYVRPNVLDLDPTCGSYVKNINWSYWGIWMATGVGELATDTYALGACPGPYKYSRVAIVLDDPLAGVFTELFTAKDGPTANGMGCVCGTKVWPKTWDIYGAAGGEKEK
jgi:hypothetical protein